MRKSPKSAVVIVLIFFLVFVSYLSSKSAQDGVQTPSFKIETVSSSCIIEYHDIDIKPEGNSLEIIVPMIAPNPCYSAVGDVKFIENSVEINMLPLSSQDVCTQCIGEVTGKVTIQDLEKGEYTIRVRTPDRFITRSVVIE